MKGTDMSNVDKIRAKISALMKKTEANGASEAEAASAMTIASKLMAEHGVTLADIKENTAAARDFSRRHVNEGAKNLSVVDKFVAVAIAGYTDTKVWNSKGFDGFKMGKKNSKPKYTSNIMFYGYSVDVELAEYIYKICDAAVELEWKKFSRTVAAGARAKARTTFQLGMSIRLRDRLIDMKKVNIDESNGKSLVVLKNQLVETSFKNDVTANLGKGGGASVTYRKGSAFEAGKKAAESVRFNREVHDGPQGGVKLLA
jgi:hypothetical protein